MGGNVLQRLRQLFGKKKSIRNSQMVRLLCELQRSRDPMPTFLTIWAFRSPTAIWHLSSRRRLVPPCATSSQLFLKPSRSKMTCLVRTFVYQCNALYFSEVFVKYLF